jgi:hypothetical protein
MFEKTKWKMSCDALVKTVRALRGHEWRWVKRGQGGTSGLFMCRTRNLIVYS